LEPKYRHYSATCNMVKHMSQLFVIGGTYTDSDACDLAVDAWSMHNFWTGTYHNEGDNETYWALFDPKVAENVVPADVYNVTGGDKDGGAKLTAPKGGFDTGNKPLEDLFARRPSIAERTPTRQVSSPTSPPSPKDPNSGLSTGAIVGIAIGGAAGLVLLLLVWYYIGKRVLRRREERRQSGMTQIHHGTYRGSVASPPSTVSPPLWTSTWRTSAEPVSPQHTSPQQSVSLPRPSPTELPTEYHGSMQGIAELPQYAGSSKSPVSPGEGSHGWSLGPPSSP
jgi:hypothetical protein